MQRVRVLGRHEQAQVRPGLSLPHPAWRNDGWLKREPWFEAELLPVLKAEVARVLAG